MKKLLFISSLLVFLTIPAVSFAIPLIDFEASIGGWMQSPAGELSYGDDVTQDDIIDLTDELNYDTKTNVVVRAKAKLPVIPGVYLIAAPMEFDGDALEGSSFEFGGEDFAANESLYSKVTLNQYDVGLYYGLPLLNLATMGKLNIDLGLNARIMDFGAEIKGSSSGIESKNIQLPIPMIFLSAQLEPMEKFAVEAELRGVQFQGNSIISFIGRLKLKVFGPAYGAAGFRYDSIKIDEESVLVETSFSGPFLELGFAM